MKNTIISIIILLIIIAGSILSIRFTESVTTDILDTLDMCDLAVSEDNWELALDHIYLANALWNKYRPIFAVFLRHDELVKITDALCRTTTLVTERNRDDFLVENSYLSEMIEFITSLDKPNFENIF